MKFSYIEVNIRVKNTVFNKSSPVLQLPIAQISYPQGKDTSSLMIVEGAGNRIRVSS